MELYRYTIKELHDKLARQEVSAVEITKSVLKRINEVDGKVKAYLTRTDKLALAQAETVDKEIKNGKELSPLAGIAGGIKDDICTKGVKTTCAAKTLADFTPPYNAFVVDNLLQQGLVMTGKTNLDEFGLGNSSERSEYFANPWDLTRTPGCGAAAAVAAGEAIWALGSDDSGSVRQSAAFCGLVGLKPTYGLISRYGLISAVSSLDQIGSVTRDVTDCALVLNAIAGYDAQDSLSINTPPKDYSKALKKDAKGLKIGIFPAYDDTDAEIKTAVFKAIESLKSLGATCVEVDLPHAKYALAAHYLIACAEASSNLARYDGVGFGYRSASPDDNIHAMFTKSRSESFGDEVKRRIILGTYALSAGQHQDYYVKAMKVRTLIKKDLEKILAQADVLIMPTTPAPAFKLGEKISDPLAIFRQDIYTVLANLAGICAISVPCGFTGGLPIGLQIIGKALGETDILQAAYAFEQNHDYHNKTAPLEGGAL